MAKRTTIPCEVCGEYMTPILGTEHSWHCNFCGANKVSTLDKEFYEKHKKTYCTF